MPFCTQCGAESPEGARFCAACGQPLDDVVPARRRARKTVTIVFSDITGSTDMGERLDSESINNLMRRYAEEMSTALERNGGTVEKFIGDAVMAVFGVPVAHEDDALRAVSAAAAMRASLELLNEELERRWGARIRVRTGVNTGEVVAGDPSKGHSFVSGDAVNVAARLEQAAGPGEIYLGEKTYALVRDAVEAEPVGGLELKGKAEPVPAFRLTQVLRTVEGVARQLDSPIVGREVELEHLERAFGRAVEGRSCGIATVIGPAGQGKSRLVRELVRSVGPRARVLEGRCLPYGEGITYWPVAEVVRSGAAITEDDSADVAMQKLSTLVPVEDREAVVPAVASALGLLELPVHADDVFRAVRSLLEALARSEPLLVVFDDIHWAEETFLDLIEYLARSTADAPMFLVCLARPEIGDLRPGFADRDGDRLLVELGPLGEAHSRRLMENMLGQALLAEDLVARIAQAAGGNPLFVEEMLRMLVDQQLLERENGRWEPTTDLTDLSVPASIEALLTARLDRLASGEQDVVEGASVIGQEFWASAVSELLPETSRPFVTSHVQTLLRKELVTSGGAEFAGERAYRFSHILVRDVAYARLLKESRSTMHERFAHWLAERVRERMPEYEEIIGYHFEQAFRYREQLGPLDEDALLLASLAAVRLGGAGNRAHHRGDMPAAAKLLERALPLMSENSAGRVEVMIRLGFCLFETGQLQRAESVLDDAVVSAVALGNRSLELRAQVELSNFRVWTAPEVGLTEVPLVVAEALPVFEAGGDSAGMARALSSMADVLCVKGRAGEMGATLERALPHAIASGDEQTETRILAGLAGAFQLGPAPADEAIIRLRQMLDDADAGPLTRAVVEAWAIAVLEAMLGNATRARRICANARSIFSEFGQANRLADLALYTARVEMLSGDPRAAEVELRKSYDALSAMGEKLVLATVTAELAEALHAQGRVPEAEGYAGESEELAEPDDVEPEILWRITKSKCVASRGSCDEAERLAREAVAKADTTDYLNLHGAAHLALAEVLHGAGRDPEAAAAAEAAKEAYAAKGNRVGLRQVEEWLRERRAPGIGAR